jgi:hypothetical protein
MLFEPVVWTEINDPVYGITITKEFAKVKVDLGVGYAWLVVRQRSVKGESPNSPDILLFVEDPGDSWSPALDVKPFAGVYGGYYPQILQGDGPSLKELFLLRLFG